MTEQLPEYREMMGGIIILLLMAFCAICIGIGIIAGQLSAIRKILREVRK